MQHGENHEKHHSTWIISLVMATYNTFKKFQWSCFWEETFCDPYFVICDSEEYDDDEYPLKELRYSKSVGVNTCF